MANPFKLMKKEQDDSDFIPIHYEQKLRAIFFENCSPDGSILDQDSFDHLIAMFIRHKLVSIADSGRLEKVQPSFPMTFGTLIQTICQAFGDQSIKQLNQYLSESKD
jgi:hypothetical protein